MNDVLEEECDLVVDLLVMDWIIENGLIFENGLTFGVAFEAVFEVACEVKVSSLIDLVLVGKFGMRLDGVATKTSK